MNEDALQKQYEAIQLESARLYRSILKTTKLVAESDETPTARLLELEVLKVAAEIAYIGQK